MIISPIYEERRSEIEAKELESGWTLSVILCFLFIFLPFFLPYGEDGSAILLFIIILFTSIIIYLAEGSAQPEAFGSIPRAFWWSTITLTTIGYGDVYPITIIGKICTVIISISGIGIVAIPTGIIAAGFSELLNKKK